MVNSAAEKNESAAVGEGTVLVAVTYDGLLLGDMLKGLPMSVNLAYRILHRKSNEIAPSTHTSLQDQADVEPSSHRQNSQKTKGNDSRTKCKEIHKSDDGASDSNSESDTSNIFEINVPVHETETVEDLMFYFTILLAKKHGASVQPSFSHFSSRLDAFGAQQQRLPLLTQIKDLPVVSHDSSNTDAMKQTTKIKYEVYLEDSELAALGEAENLFVRGRRGKVPGGTETLSSFENEHDIFQRVSDAIQAVNFRRCHVLCDRILQDNSQSTKALDISYLALARLFVQTKRPDEAYAMISKVSRDETNSDVIEEFYGEIAALKSDWSAAAQHFSSARMLTRDGDPEHVQKYVHRKEGSATRPILREHLLAAEEAYALLQMGNMTMANGLLQQLLLREKDGNENARALETYGDVVMMTGFFAEGLKLKIQALTANPADKELCERVCSDMISKPGESIIVVHDVLNSTTQLRTNPSGCAFLADIAKSYGALEVSEFIYELAMVNTPGLAQIFRCELDVLEMQLKYVQMLQLCCDCFESFDYGKEYIKYYLGKACTGIVPILYDALRVLIPGRDPGPRARNRYAFKLTKEEETVDDKIESNAQCFASLLSERLQYIIDTGLIVEESMVSITAVYPYAVRNYGRLYHILVERHPSAVMPKPQDQKDDEKYGPTSIPHTMAPDAWSAIAEDCRRQAPYSHTEILLIASVYQAVKAFFLLGPTFLRFIPAMLSHTESLRDSLDELHTSAIRNEYITHLHIALTLQSHQQYLGPTSLRLPRRKIYMVGDSHVISAAWQQGKVNRKPYIIVPKLATGMHAAYLRNNERICTRMHFDRLIDSVPDESVVIFCLGEMDCREGLLEMVRRDQYTTLQEAVNYVVVIYITKIIMLSRQKKLHVFVHPVPPAADGLRPLIDLFNSVLQEKCMAYAKHLSWIDILPRLLDESNAGDGCPSSNGSSSASPSSQSSRPKLKETFYLDGVHLHPTYSDVLCQAMEPRLRDLLEEGKFDGVAPLRPCVWRKWQAKREKRNTGSADSSKLQ
mmetsp:Transcript_18789/g.36812  ORF Transcript_18789/g.36812 Transcript_18789/m.36812 type:complete len:1030 (-) Transcript_18789:1803-4892(-)|eukprot:CAMPEP_0171568206 /NCGR_PEP_ID=MMETSP0961-20121227/1618_1 /TAXON_ID=87120 /ORGANISM="Aurantiochytrium limacinum, Strain ATCCMYA-1381" /LENGTH=1029 /DNA_ID=CAMNT_0012122275 /DNA_START=324 /DNA_END=3413 /DNA_ORIENTATION=-